MQNGSILSNKDIVELGPILNRPVFVLNKLSNDHLVRKLTIAFDASCQIYNGFIFSHCKFSILFLNKKQNLAKLNNCSRFFNLNPLKSLKHYAFWLTEFDKLLNRENLTDIEKTMISIYSPVTKYSLCTKEHFRINGATTYTIVTAIIPPRM